MQRTPSIVRQALLPRPLHVGKIKLLPVTIGHALLLDEIDSPLLRETGIPLDTDAIHRGVFVLTRPWQQSFDLLDSGTGVSPVHSEFDHAICAFAARELNLKPLLALEAILKLHIDRALASYSETEYRTDDDGGEQLISADGNGCGTLLNLVSALGEITGWGTDKILDTALITAFALVTASNIRANADWISPSYTILERWDNEDSAAGGALEKEGASESQQQDGGNREEVEPDDQDQQNRDHRTDHARDEFTDRADSHTGEST